MENFFLHEAMKNLVSFLLQPVPMLLFFFVQNDFFFVSAIGIIHIHGFRLEAIIVKANTTSCVSCQSFVLLYFVFS